MPESEYQFNLRSGIISFWGDTNFDVLCIVLLTTAVGKIIFDASRFESQESHLDSKWFPFASVDSQEIKVSWELTDCGASFVTHTGDSFSQYPKLIHLIYCAGVLDTFRFRRDPTLISVGFAVTPGRSRHNEKKRYINTAHFLQRKCFFLSTWKAKKRLHLKLCAWATKPRKE